MHIQHRWTSGTFSFAYGLPPERKRSCSFIVTKGPGRLKARAVRLSRLVDVRSSRLVDVRSLAQTFSSKSSTHRNLTYRMRMCTGGAG